MQFKYSDNTLSHELILNANDINTMNQLILNGADLNYINKNNWCLLFELIAINNIKAITHFSKHDLNLNIKDSKGRTCLFWAIYFKSNDIFKLLITLGVDINEDIINGMPPLQYTIYKENIILVKYLLAQKYLLFKKDCFDKDPLYYASECKNKDIYQLIKDNNI